MGPQVSAVSRGEGGVLKTWTWKMWEWISCKIVPSCIFHPLQNHADISIPAKKFLPCRILPIFPLLHIPPLHFWPCQFFHSHIFSRPSLGRQPTGDMVIDQAVGCHYFPPGLRLPSQPDSITANWPVPNYNVWWKRHVREQLTQSCYREA